MWAWMIFFGIAFVLRKNIFEFRKFPRSQVFDEERLIHLLDELLLEVEMGRAIEEKVRSYLKAFFPHEEDVVNSQKSRSRDSASLLQEGINPETPVQHEPWILRELHEISQARFHRRERLLELRKILHLIWHRKGQLKAFLFQARFQSVFVLLLWLIIWLSNLFASSIKGNWSFHLLSLLLMLLGTFIQVWISRIPRWKT